MGSVTTLVHHEIPEIRVRDWVQVLVACVAACAVVYFSWENIRLPFRASIELAVHQDGRDIRITWNRAATRGGGNLEILDGPRHMALFVPPDLSSVSYRALTTDVEVRLGRMRDPLQTEITRCLVPEVSSISILAREMAAVQANAVALRGAFIVGTRHLERLQHEADRLVTIVPAPTRATFMRWWR